LITAILIPVLVLYTVLIITLLIGWEHHGKSNHRHTNSKYFISVLIPVRNEENNIKNLLTDLECQDISPDAYEVIVINDDSSDRTIKIVEKFKNQSTLNLKIIEFKNDNSRSPKKAALKIGIKKSIGDLIVTTDGDCRVKSSWLSTIQTKFGNSRYELVFGPVLIHQTNFLSKLQNIEIASLVGFGSGSLKLGIPNMCNGANLAFKKKVFDQINGYEGNEEIASGDDEFLMHKVFKNKPGSVGFLKDPAALVTTLPNTSWKEIYHQKRRWASKWSYYILTSTKIIGALAFGLNLGWVLIYIAGLLNLLPLQYLLISLLIKIVIEFLLVWKVLGFFNQRASIPGFLLISIAYPIYVSVFGLLSRFGNYHWKGREYAGQ